MHGLRGRDILELDGCGACALNEAMAEGETLGLGNGRKKRTGVKGWRGRTWVGGILIRNFSITQESDIAGIANLKVYLRRVSRKMVSAGTDG